MKDSKERHCLMFSIMYICSNGAGARLYCVPAEGHQRRHSFMIYCGLDLRREKIGGTQHFFYLNRSKLAITESSVTVFCEVS